MDAYTDETIQVYLRTDMTLWCFGHDRPDDECERFAPEEGCNSVLIVSDLDAEPMALMKIVDCPSWCNWGYEDRHGRSVKEHNHENWTDEHKWTSAWIKGT